MIHFVQSIGTDLSQLGEVGLGDAECFAPLFDGFAEVMD